MSAFRDIVAIAATNPLGVAALLLLCAAFVLVVFRVWRHRQLLRALEKFPEKDRLAALQAELGDVRPAGGLDGERYLRSRAYMYAVYGLAILSTAAVLWVSFHYWGVPHRGSGIAELDITLLNGAKDTLAELGRRRLVYSAQRDLSVPLDVDNKFLYERTTSGIRVSPSSEYVTRFRRGGPILGGEDIDIGFSFPVLSLKVNNNTASTVFLTEITISVHANKIDREPMLLIGSHTVDRIVLVNEGWGKVIDPVLAFGVVPWARCRDLDISREDKAFIKKIDSFERTAEVAMEEFWSLISLDRTEPNDRSQALRVMTFGARLVCIYGRIEYKSEQSRHHGVTFKTIIWQGQPPPLYGAAMSMSMVQMVFVEAGKRQTIRLPIEVYLKPGEVEHLGLILVTDKSSRMTMDVGFVSTGVTVATKTVEAEIIVPYSKSLTRVASEPQPSRDEGTVFFRKKREVLIDSPSSDFNRRPR